jgi:hypothetical protein
MSRRRSRAAPREHPVAAAIVQGRSNAGIAAQLHMSLATVKAYVSRLLANLAPKTGFRSRCSSTTPQPAVPTAPASGTRAFNWRNLASSARSRALVPAMAIAVALGPLTHKAG